MKRTDYKKMKETGWDRFVEYAIYNGYTPQDLLKEQCWMTIRSHLSTVSLCNKINENLYVSSISDIKAGQALASILGINAQISKDNK